MKHRRTITLTARTLYGPRYAILNSHQIADLAGVNVKTAQRYIRDPQAIPGPTLELLQIKACGLIGDPAFDGWQARDGKLFSPIGRVYTPGYLDSSNWLHDRAGVVDRRNMELEAKIDRLEKTVDYWRRQAGQAPAANDADGAR